MYFHYSFRITPCISLSVCVCVLKTENIALADPEFTT